MLLIGIPSRHQAKPDADATFWILHAILNVAVQERLVVIQHDLIVEQIHELVSRQVIQLEVEVVCVQRVCYRLILRVVELGEKGVFEGLLDCDTLLRCNHEHLPEQVQGEWVVVCEQFVKLLEVMHVTLDVRHEF